MSKATGVEITIDTEKIDKDLDYHRARECEVIEVSVAIDGKTKEMTFAEFRKRIFLELLNK